MKAMRPTRVGALAALLFLAACVADAPKQPEVDATKGAQIASLKKLAGKQKKIQLFAELLPDIAKAEIKLRSRRAIVFLTPHKGAAVGRRSIETVNSYIAGQTGLERKQIMIRLRKAAEVTR